MRTSESKELQKLIDLSSGFEFEIPKNSQDELAATLIGTSNSPH
jgi:hypothetical protein